MTFEIKKCICLFFIEKNDKNTTSLSDTSVRTRQPKICKSDKFVNIVN